jgi:integrase
MLVCLYGGLDPAANAAVLGDHHARAHARAVALGEPLNPDAFVFSAEPDGQLPLNPDTATQRYQRMATRLGINTTLKNPAALHRNRTDQWRCGPADRSRQARPRGRGATTLRVYAAWTSEADQRAARTVSGRMPARPRGVAEKPSRTGLARHMSTQRPTRHI